MTPQRQIDAPGVGRVAGRAVVLDSRAVPVGSLARARAMSRWWRAFMCRVWGHVPFAPIYERASGEHGVYSEKRGPAIVRGRRVEDPVYSCARCGRAIRFMVDYPNGWIAE